MHFFHFLSYVRIILNDMSGHFFDHFVPRLSRKFLIAGPA